MLPDHYTLENVTKAVNQPKYFVDEFERATYNLLYGTPGGVDIMSEDWDNCLILDACRYDMFKECNWLDGDLQSRVSAGSSSLEWIESNFMGENLHDTVYVSGNVYTPRIEDDVFHSIQTIDAEKIEDAEHYQNMDQSFERAEKGYAILPETVVEKSVMANEKFPNKRLIVHFIQPHTPMIGRKGLKMAEEILSDKETLPTREGEGLASRWGALKFDIYEQVNDDNHGITDKDIKEAYRENLTLVLRYAEDLIEALPGKSVLTADHGEMLGEKIPPLWRKKYDHITGLRTEELRKVPWFVCSSDERKEIVSEPPVDSVRMNEAEIERKLQALGYK